MFVDFTPAHQWFHLNRYIAKDFSFDQDRDCVRIYKNLSHALYEICLGLIKSYPHKKNIYYFKNMNPYFDSLITDLALEGVKVKPLDLNLLKNPEPFLKELSSGDLFLLYARDDPLLGKIFNMKIFLEAFKKASSYQKIFLISISHRVHFYDLLEQESNSASKKGVKGIYSLDPYEVEIGSYGKKGALAFLGLRSRKLESLFASKLSWEKEEYDQMKFFFQSHFKKNSEKNSEKNNEKGSDSKSFHQAFKERRLQVLGFENQRIEGGGFKSFFLKGDLRTFDRAVIYWEDMDGFAFIEELSKALGFFLLRPGDEMRLETTSLTRWGGVQTMDWLKSFGLSENQIRGLILIDVTLINEGLLNLVKKVRENLLNLQRGSLLNV